VLARQSTARDLSSPATPMDGRPRQDSAAVVDKSKLRRGLLTPKLQVC
jgi:hypothetical protein